MTTDYSLSDIAAATGNSGNNGNNGGDGWGNNGAWWIILFFIFAWGWGGFGNGFGGRDGAGVGVNSPAGQGALTRGDLCMDMNFQEVKREIQNANDAVNLGFANLNSTICNQAYETAGLINGLGNTIQQGFNATNVSMLQGFNAVQSQAADCCCKTQSGIEGLKYTIASEDCNTRSTIQNGLRDSIENANANTRAILQKLDDQAMEAKNAQIAALNQQLFAAQLSASQVAQNQYLVNQLRPCPQPCYLTCSPYYTYNPVAANGCNSGCGCGCGNIG